MKLCLNIVPIVFGFLGFAAFASCSPCGYRTKSEEHSPSGRLIAAVTVVDCGAVGHDVTQVNVRDARSSFSADDGTAIIVEDTQLITTWWRDDQNLTIYLPKTLSTDKLGTRPIASKQSNVGHVHIDYQFL